MARRWRILLLLGVAVVLLVVVALVILDRAARHVPEFYRRALVDDAAARARASDEMLRRAAALGGDVKQPGRWRALFTAEQLNGWLAVDLPRNHPGTLPPEVEDPRVAIEGGRVLFGCGYRRGEESHVLWASVEPSLPKPNLLVLRITEARVGKVPLPRRELIARLSEAAASAGWALRWQDAGGDPVALLHLGGLIDTHRNLRVVVDTLRLGDGEVFLSGTTDRTGGQP